MYSNTNNKYHVLIEKYDSKFKWIGILLKFSANNMKQFFKLIKLQKVNWEILEVSDDFIFAISNSMLYLINYKLLDKSLSWILKVKL